MSIRENGIVQPVLVRPNGSRFELVAGERRWRAAQAAGLERIPAVVREIANDKVLELALIENIQREDLNAIEEARAYKKLIETVGLTQESLAQRVGRDRSYITNHIRLLRLPEDLQQLVQEGKLSGGHARTLLGTDDVAAQRRIARKIIQKGLSVRETERVMQQLTSSVGKPAPQASCGAGQAIPISRRRRQSCGENSARGSASYPAVQGQAERLKSSIMMTASLIDSMTSSWPERRQAIK